MPVLQLLDARFKVMNDGCILADAGHFDVEVNIPAAEGAGRGGNPPAQAY